VRAISAGRPLAREDAPALFALLDEVGEEVGVGTVSDVRLKPGPLMAAARVLRPGRFVVTERRALVIGLPLLRLLSPEQMRAAVAHELAHLAGGDVRRGRIVNRAWRRIALMRAVLERRRGPMSWPLTYLNPIWWYLVAYGALLRGGAALIRRRQEARADGLAARVVGAEAYAASLVHVAGIGIAFRRLSPGLLVKADEEGRSIENFYEDFAGTYAALSDSGRRALVRDALTTHDEGGDHPPLRERLEDLGVHGPTSLQRTGGCVALVPQLAEIERRMTPLVIRGLRLGLAQAIRRRRARRERAATPA
jgi:Zn-dependent protease with chaperone function